MRTDARRMPLNAHSEQAARARQHQLTKPPGSLGRLEELACWFAARLGEVAPAMPRCEIFVFAADHGVAGRGVSAFPQSVTAEMVRNFRAGGAAINVLARLADCRLEVIDVGVGRGTCDLSVGAAMSLEEARIALSEGERCANESATRGARLLIAGDMGIGNTTAAACLISAFTGAEPARVVGRGTGIDDDSLARKVRIVSDAVARVRYASALQILAECGGLEIAAMAGLYMQSARLGIPVVLDGYISAAAALCAVALEPASREWMLASHLSAESGHVFALDALGLTPLLDLKMRLGEGSGAALALPLIRAALALHRDMATFSEAGVSSGVASP
jgi:nicotinate-nucleotide--dimethylbenzimidazole phosphoribosyltransferase